MLLCSRLLSAFAKPFKRGFFCDDETLMHPYHDSTVGSSLEIVGYGLPITIIAATEFARWRLSANQISDLKLFDRDIPLWAVNIYKFVGIFLFGASLNVLTTDIAKHMIGRLRPHFFDVCQPVMPDGSNCSNPINMRRYIEEYSCGNSASSAVMLKDMRMSFPSGHSSFSMYTMIFAVVYLHSRISWNGSKLLKPLVQFLLIMMAWFTALSRIPDYKHHCKSSTMELNLTQTKYILLHRVRCPFWNADRGDS